MPKVKMVCLNCGYNCEWYESLWREVMERKFKEGFLCADCTDELKEIAVAEFYIKYLSSGR